MFSGTIGIVGGAGPMAGLLLAKKVISTCQTQYGCVSDADFPRMLVLSVPFAQMLEPGSDRQQENQVSEQLRDALDLLRQSGAERIAIACNTLHAFLAEDSDDLINLLNETQRVINRRGYKKVLALCTSTSVQKGLHNYLYPDTARQAQVDQMITRVLKGDTSNQTRQRLEQVLQAEIAAKPEIDAILLGCTELSVLLDGAVHLAKRPLIDPVDIAATALTAR